ncbi:hypothetical protein FHS96_005823 [Sphingomonas zeicaulis]|uniref:hypothetical protein n=1 Tax=Sphingomonas zeicaulis TaxID=1632740 RepID=UPI003D1B85D1
MAAEELIWLLEGVSRDGRGENDLASALRQLPEQTSSEFIAAFLQNGDLSTSYMMMRLSGRVIRQQSSIIKIFWAFANCREYRMVEKFYARVMPRTKVSTVITLAKSGYFKDMDKLTRTYHEGAILMCRHLDRAAKKRIANFL